MEVIDTSFSKHFKVLTAWFCAENCANFLSEHTGRGRRRTVGVMFPLIFLLAACADQSLSPEAAHKPPEYTDKLIVYCGDALMSNILDDAVWRYNIAFGKNVELEIREFGDPEDPETARNYRDVLQAELAAGKGPDVILWYEGLTFDDTNKLMESGIFENLDGYLASDKDFDTECFSMGVLDAGIYKGQRLFVPLDYQVPILISTNEALARAGVALSTVESHSGTQVAPPTFEEFAALTENYQSHANEDEWFMDKLGWDLRTQLLFSGLTFADYETDNGSSGGAVNINEQQFRKFMEWYKTLYDITTKREDRGVSFPFERAAAEPGELGAQISKNKILLGYETDEVSLRGFMPDFYLFATDFSYLFNVAKEQQPVFFSMPPAGGGKPAARLCHCAAIRKNSENKANAYEFIKILLMNGYRRNNNNYYTNLMTQTHYRRFSQSLASTWGSFQGQFSGGYGRIDVNEGIPRLDGTIFMDYKSVVIDVTAYVYSKNVLDFVCAAMQPYLDDNKTFDACLDELQDKLEIYIAE